MEKRQKKRNDLILIAGMLAVSLLVYGGLRFRESRAAGQAMVVIRAYDEIVGEYPLNRDLETRIDIGGGEYNELVIRDGQARVSAASCPDQICVGHSPISEAQELIVCLPHELIVEINYGS